MTKGYVKIARRAATSLILASAFLGQAIGEGGDLWHVHGKLAADGTVLIDEFIGSSMDVDPITGDLWSIDVIFDEEYGEWDETYTILSRRDQNGNLINRETLDFYYGPNMKVDHQRGNLWIFNEHGTAETYDSNDLSYKSRSDDWRLGHIEINPLNGEAWVSKNDAIGPLDPEGNLVPTFPAEGIRSEFKIKPADGSCWVASLIRTDPNDHYSYATLVVKYLADGAEVFRTILDGSPTDFEIDPYSDSCWVASGFDTLTKLDADGNVLFDIETSSWYHVVDPTDGSCWIRGGKFGADGTLLFTAAMGNPCAIDTGRIHLGYSAIEHANSDMRLWADEGLVELKPDSRIGERAQWVITTIGGGYSKIVNRKTGELLRAANDGEGLTMTTELSGKALWEVERSKDRTYFNLKNKRFGSYLRGQDERGLWLEKSNNPGPNFRWKTADHQ